MVLLATLLAHRGRGVNAFTTMIASRQQFAVRSLPRFMSTGEEVTEKTDAEKEAQKAIRDARKYV
jgi:hypothetical protein